MDSLPKEKQALLSLSTLQTSGQKLALLAMPILKHFFVVVLFAVVVVRIAHT